MKIKGKLSGLVNSIQTQITDWNRSLRLIWAASPYYTTAWAILLLFQGLIPGLLVYLTKLVVDALLVALNNRDDWSQIRPAVFLILTFASVTLLSEILQSLMEMVRAAQADIIQDYVKSLVHDKSAITDMAHFESHEYHDRLEQATSDGANRPLSLLESIGGVMQNTITLMVMAGLLIQYSVWLSVALIFSSLPTFLIVLKFDRVFHNWWKGTTPERRWIQYFDVLLTHPVTVPEMRVFRLYPYFQAKYQKLRKKLRTEKLIQMRRLGIAKLFAAVLSLIILAASLIWMGSRALYGALTLGDLALFYQAFTRGQGLMRTLLNSLGQMIKNSLFVKVLFEFLDLESGIIDPEKPEPTPVNLVEGISINNITFSYPESSRPVFSNFSMFIPAGKTVAIVGENGSGKTTLLKLICRFYDPKSGTIEFDGVDTRKFAVANLLKMITITFQQPLHFHATLSESIAMGDMAIPATPEQIELAARGAGAHEFIDRLPDKYGTLLGKVHGKGTDLSGGEWQRLALARAYFRKAPIVLLDEPTSFMDSWSEADWFQRFRSLTRGRTAVVITHRFTIAMRADIIHVMSKGEIIESGTHRELLGKDGFYAKSWKEQMQAAELHGSESEESLSNDEDLRVLI